MEIDLDNLVKTRVDGQGRLLIPVALREKMGLKPHGHVAMFVDDDGLHVLTTHLTIKRAQREFAEFVPEGVSLSEELLADRRAEAAREDAE